MSKKHKDNSLIEVGIFLSIVFANILIIAGTDIGKVVLEWSQQYTGLLMVFGMILAAGAAAVQKFVTIQNKILQTACWLIIGYLLSLLLALVLLNAPPRP